MTSKLAIQIDSQLVAAYASARTKGSEALQANSVNRSVPENSAWAACA